MAAMSGKSKASKVYLLAGGLLVVMAGLWALAWRWHLPMVQAFAEAALVGGLADWFAVTALFRRPLGLPIPHTALIPANKQRLGQALGDFVCDNFLAPDLVASRLRRFSPAAWLADRLTEPKVARAMARRLARAFDDTDTRDGLIALIQPGPPLAQAVRLAARNHWHQSAFDRLLDAVQKALRSDNSFILAKVADGSGRWVPAWLDRKLAGTLSQALADGLDDLRRADHPWRLGFDAWVARLAERLQDDPALASRLQAVRDTVLREALSQTSLEPLLSAAFAAWGRNLAADQAVRARFDRRFLRLTERLLVPSRREIGAFIADVVGRWDSPTLVAKLESQIGPDLQYIRVNGTLVGGLVGLALYGLSHLLG